MLTEADPLMLVDTEVNALSTVLALAEAEALPLVLALADPLRLSCCDWLALALPLSERQSKC
ncbi:hypothetical protein [Lacticaseibacillus nasuensis]|uniref:hypothetical protein n=1 Tax=Lacticaseibacillus nasuensis TaxID=944671 RepID=UPI0006D289F1|nr:hypothetical protein [Lacticaseibacillus nasuensis]